MSKFTIAVDVMGGDNAPEVNLQGIRDALAADTELKVIACGLPEAVDTLKDLGERCQIQYASEVIAMGEHPAQAVRKKKDSSIVVGCRLVKEGLADGFFSAGSTGAVLAAATLVTGRIKGISRPMLATIVPSPAKPVLLCDCGANADCKPEYLVQFGTMAGIFMKQVMGVENPQISLLNIGEEETKGSEFAQTCHQLMKENVPGFAGNSEGGDILKGSFDVFVTDGFTGNVTLKSIEGTAKVLMKSIKGIMKSSLVTKLGALTMKKDLYAFANTMSSDTYGGAPLLGVKGACLIGHGSSNALAVKNGILFTEETARKQVPQLIAAALEAQKEEASAAETAN